MKFSTVFGASFSSSRTTIFPWDVSKMAYVPDGRLMHSPGVLNHPTRAAAARATCLPLPAFLFSQFGDVRRVVFSVPLIEEKEPIDGAFAVLWVHQNTCE